MKHDPSKGLPLLKSSLNRRQVVRGVAGSALALPALSIFGGPAYADDVEVLDITPELIDAAKKEGQVFLRYSSPVDVYPPVAEAFKNEFGIDLVTDRKVGPVGQQVFAQEEHAGKHNMDVVETGDPAGVKALDKEGLYLHFTFKDLDQKIKPGFYLPDLGYNPFPNSLVIEYNPEVLSHEDAKRLFTTWEGVFDASLQGALGITDPTAVAVCFGLCLMWYRTPKYGMDFIKKLGQTGVRVYRGSAFAREDLSAGAIKAFLSGWEGVAMQNYERGVSVAWTYADIEPNYPNLFICISKNAPHPNAARLFVSWLFSAHGAEAYAKTQNRSSVIGLPDTRSAVAKLKETDWWKPYPESVGWLPDVDDWINNFAELAPQFQKALNGG